MKIYISADIEGCAGMAAPSEANSEHADISDTTLAYTSKDFLDIATMIHFCVR